MTGPASSTSRTRSGHHRNLPAPSGWHRCSSLPRHRPGVAPGPAETARGQHGCSHPRRWPTGRRAGRVDAYTRSRRWRWFRQDRRCRNRPGFVLPGPGNHGSMCPVQQGYPDSRSRTHASWRHANGSPGRWPGGGCGPSSSCRCKARHSWARRNQSTACPLRSRYLVAHPSRNLRSPWSRRFRDHSRRWLSTMPEPLGLSTHRPLRDLPGYPVLI